VTTFSWFTQSHDGAADKLALLANILYWNAITGAIGMADGGRVITAKLDDELVEQLDEIAERIERSKSWIVREAVSQWLSEEQRRHELTLEALRDVDEGRTIGHDEMKAWAAERKRKARAQRAA
jgi:predicted transcriptional regulator